MMMMLFSLLSLSSFLVLSHSAAAQGNAESYFGGVGNEEYLQWLEEEGDSYAGSIFIATDVSPDEGMAIHWNIQDGSLYMAAIAKATGWLSFGLSEAGGMPGADLLVYEVAHPTLVTDGHILDNREINVDDCQDWVYVDARQGEEFLMVEARRLLNTGDSQDREIMQDDSLDIPVGRVIAAWGDSETAIYHGPDNRARGAVRWHKFGQDPMVGFLEKMDEVAEGSFVVQAENYPIKPRETEYKSFCVFFDDLVGQQGLPDARGMSIVGIEPLIDPIGAPYVSCSSGTQRRTDC